MKNGIKNGVKGDKMFGIILLAIILLIIFACLFSWFCWKSKKTEGFLDERYFHHNDIGKLIPTDPPMLREMCYKMPLWMAKKLTTILGPGKKKRSRN